MKKTKFFVLAMIIIMICTAMLSLVACKPKPEPPTNKDDTGIFDVEQNAINMKATVTSNAINIALSTIDATQKGSVDIVAVKAHQYLASDNYKGLSGDIVSDYKSKIIGSYNLGENKTISIDRYQDSYDRLYDKFYAVQGDKIIKGPIYATSITALNNAEPDFNI